MGEKEQIIIRCESSLKKDAKDRAAAENRTLSNFIITLLQKEIYGEIQTGQNRKMSNRDNVPEPEPDPDSVLNQMKHNFK